MARVAFACASSPGHINFTLPIAKRLRQEGHTVLYLTMPRPWVVTRLMDEGFPLLAFDPEAFYGLFPAPFISYEDVQDWPALARIYRRNFSAGPEGAWPHLDRRYQRHLLGLDPSEPFTLDLPRKMGLLCLLNEALRDRDLAARLATWDNDRRERGGAGAALAPGPTLSGRELRFWNRGLLESSFFPGVFRPRPPGTVKEGGPLRQRFERLRRGRQALRKLCHRLTSGASGIEEYFRLLSPDVFLFEPGASLWTLLNADLLEGVLVAELQYSFFSEPGTSHPPLDSTVVADGRAWSRLQIAAQWARRVGRFRAQRWGTELLAGTSLEGVLAKLLATERRAQAPGLAPARVSDVSLSYTWDGRPDLRSSPKLIFSPQELEFPGLLPPEGRCRYLKPILPEVTASPVFEDDGEGTSSELFVYCTLGTTIPSMFPASAVAFFKKIAAIFAGKPAWRLVISAWTDHCVAAIGPCASNVVVKKSVPQSALLSRCVLSIHHGGHNTIMDCVQHGVPMLLCPHPRTDQRGNAARAVRHGLALIAKASESEARLDQKVTRLLQDGAFRRNVLAMRERMHSDLPTNYFQVLTDAIRTMAGAPP